MSLSQRHINFISLKETHQIPFSQREISTLSLSNTLFHRALSLKESYQLSRALCLSRGSRRARMQEFLPCALALAFWLANLLLLFALHTFSCILPCEERWGAGVDTQKNVREEIGGWNRVPFNEPYAPSLSTIYDAA